VPKATRRDIRVVFSGGIVAAAPDHYGITEREHGGCLLGYCSEWQCRRQISADLAELSRGALLFAPTP
jgi:hypothetical protein